VVPLLLSTALRAKPVSGAGSVPVSDALSRKVQSRFIAPCCWQESVAVHQSPIADEMRREITEKLRQGRSEDEIIAFYAARYGERILWAPRGRRYFWLVLMPLVALAAGSLLVTSYLVKYRSRPQVPIPAGKLPPDIHDDFDF